MTGRDPMEYAWWLASRASGIVALALISLSVILGLAMAGRVSRDPKLRRTMIAVHEQAALAALIAIAVHAITLLGDKFLDPGPVGILVPFQLDHAPFYTGLGRMTRRRSVAYRRKASTASMNTTSKQSPCPWAAANDALARSAVDGARRAQARASEDKVKPRADTRASIQRNRTRRQS